jgi:hypothetical protein
MPPLPLDVQVSVERDGREYREQESVGVRVQAAHLGKGVEEGPGGQGAGGPAGELEVAGVVEGVGLVAVVRWVEQVMGQVKLVGVVCEEALENALLGQELVLRLGEGDGGAGGVDRGEERVGGSC